MTWQAFSWGCYAYSHDQILNEQRYPSQTMYLFFCHDANKKWTFIWFKNKWTVYLLDEHNFKFVTAAANVHMHNSEKILWVVAFGSFLFGVVSLIFFAISSSKTYKISPYKGRFCHSIVDWKVRKEKGCPTSWDFSIHCGLPEIILLHWFSMADSALQQADSHCPRGNCIQDDHHCPFSLLFVSYALFHPKLTVVALLLFRRFWLFCAFIWREIKKN